MTPQDAHLSDLILHWAKNPAIFVTDALRVKVVSAQQKQAIEEVRKLVWAKIKAHEGKRLTDEEKSYSRKIGISIMSGMGTGKNAFDSWMIDWFLCCFPRPLIPCVGPTAHQLKDNLWRELYKWRNGDPDDPPVVKDWLTWQSDKFYFTPQEGRDWFAVSRTANPRDNPDQQAETLQGFHEDFMMIVVDEASAVPDPVFRPLEGTLTGKCNFILMTFNPTRSQGFAVESQTKYRDNWVCLHWDAEESEIVSKTSVEEKAKKFGRDSNFFRINVKGYPPLTSEDTLIPWDWVMDAVDRPLDALPEDKEVFGVDVGAGGDPSVIVRVRGPIIYPIDQFESADSELLTNWIMDKTYKYDPLYEMVDTIGVGWAIEGNLRQRLRGTGTIVVGVAVSEAASIDFKYSKLRDELAWRVREKFEKRIITMGNDPLLIGELTTIRYTEPLGKIKVESKKELFKRGLKSPNRFDALCLANYYDSIFTRRSKDRAPRNWRNAKGRGAGAVTWRGV